MLHKDIGLYWLPHKLTHEQNHLIGEHGKGAKTSQNPEGLSQEISTIHDSSKPMSRGVSTEFFELLRNAGLWLLCPLRNEVVDIDPAKADGLTCSEPHYVSFFLRSAITQMRLI